MARCRGGCGPPCQPGHGVRRLGLLVGNWVLHLVEADTANQFVHHLAEATLALVLFTDAVRVNRGRLKHESAVPGRLLGIGLPLTILAGTAAELALFPQLNLWTAAALATMLAPPTPRSGCRWSPTRGSPPTSARASTSRAA
jgi:NhaP-type Na+/H+ or K+/H+ antiporter